MADIDHLWGGDIGSSPSGDMGTVDKVKRGVQRILRRLMTRGEMTTQADGISEPGEYIWHQGYGASVPQRIGQALDVNHISSVIRSQILKEASVAASPAPQFTFTPFLNGVTVLIVYVDKSTGKQNQLSFDVNS